MLKVDILHKRYGKWIVVKYSHYQYGDRYWVLKCDCGIERVMAKKTLNRGRLKPCECQTKSSSVNMIDKVFGRLRVTSASIKKNYYDCLCNCGNNCTVWSYNLLRGKINSCGCIYFDSNSKHGYASLSKGKTDEYNCWVAMKQRCYDKKTTHYNHYGGRGIFVCKRWLNDFELFLIDMGNKPSKKHSIDRKDVNGNYNPSNCRWATKREQARNKRNNIFYTINGEKYIQIDLIELLNISYKSFYQIIKNKSTEEVSAILSKIIQ